MNQLPIIRFLAAPVALGTCLLALATPMRAATFDVTDYTAAFSACLNDLVAAGGGKMFLPDGVYRGRIIIPPRGGPSWITVEIVGESEA